MRKRLVIASFIVATIAAATASGAASTGTGATVDPGAGSTLDSGTGSGSAPASNSGTGSTGGSTGSTGVSTSTPDAGAKPAGTRNTAPAGPGAKPAATGNAAPTGPGAKPAGSGSTGAPAAGPKAGSGPKTGTGNTGSHGSGSKAPGSNNNASSPGAASKSSAAAHPHDIPVGRFSAGDLSGWKDQPHKGKTEYSLDGPLLKAHALKAASGLVKKVAVDARKYPKLTWSWKVDHSLKHEDIKTKRGDDFAARVYVIFPRTFFWRMRAINYVWANKMPKGSEAPSPYTKNSMIIAVESGDEKAGTLVQEERNIYEDYKRIFGEEPPQLGGVAILTDTDDTQDEATAWYGDITLGAP